MAKRGREGKGASKASKAKKRAVARYGASAVRKYHSSSFAPETKYFDTAFSAAVTGAGTDWSSTEVPMTSYINSSGAVAAYTDSAMIPSAVGSGYGQVMGNKYKLKALRVKGTLAVAVTTNSATIPEARISRLLLVMDKQPNGAQAQGEDVLQDMGGAINNLDSFMRVSEGAGRRFAILGDRKFKHESMIAQRSQTLATDPITASSNYQLQSFKFAYAPKTPLEVQIKSGNAAPTIAGLVNTNIFLLALGITNAGSVIAVTVSGNARAYFCD